MIPKKAKDFYNMAFGAGEKKDRADALAEVEKIIMQTGSYTDKESWVIDSILEKLAALKEKDRK